jgi:hypothetical protein
MDDRKSLVYLCQFSFENRKESWFKNKEMAEGSKNVAEIFSWRLGKYLPGSYLSRCCWPSLIYQGLSSVSNRVQVHSDKTYLTNLVSNNNPGFTRLNITKKHYWPTKYIFRQIMSSSGDTIDSPDDGIRICRNIYWVSQ